MRNNKFEAATKVFIFYILIIFPLLVGTNGVYYNITVSKYVFFLIGLGLYLISYIYLLVTDKQNRPDLKPNAAQVCIVLYMLWSFISACISKYPWWPDKMIGQSRYEALISIFAYGIAFLLVSYSFAEDRGIMKGFVIVSLIMGLIAVDQCMGSKILYPGTYDYPSSHFLSTIGNIDCYSGFVSVAIPVLFCTYVFSDHKYRYVILLNLFLLMYSQLFCDVDTGKLALAAAFLVALPFLLDEPLQIAKTVQGFGSMVLSFAAYKHFKFVYLALALVILAAGFLFERYLKQRKTKIKFPSKKIIRIIIVVLEVLVVIAVLLFVYNYKGDYRLLTEASKFLHGEFSENMGTGRGYIWKTTVELIKTHPFVGGGPGTFIAEFSATDINGRYGSNSHSKVDFAHNDFLQIAENQGLIGLFFYLCFVIVLLVRGIITVSKRDQKAVIYLAGCVGFLGYSFFVFSIAIVSPFFWIMAGILEAKAIKKQ